ncbi:MAG: type II secretion system minor pseudopilin GspK [Thermodesulfobacteriota bacterium]|nr:MAG: type II secretion system minor pseudopilin GspK [Thermodesulfobacteriota bacterium]
MISQVFVIIERFKSGKAIKGKSGLALVTVLLVVAVLTALVTDFIYRSYVASSRVAALKDSARAGVLAADGVSLARAGIEEFLKKEPNIVTDESGLVFSKPLEDGLGISIRATDERSRASLRIAYPMTGALDQKLHGIMTRLLKEKRAGEELADALADWIDNDSTPRPRGAEEQFYKGLAPPYAPRNGFPESVEELLLVKGFTPDVFQAVGGHLTPYSPDGLVNVNTAPRPVLASLSEEMTNELADEIIRYRKNTPFTDRSQVMKVPGFEKAGFTIQDRITTTSNIWRIHSRARAGEVIREVEAVVQIGGGVLYWREM